MAEVDAPSVAFVYRISPEDEWAAAQAAGALQGGQLDSTSGYIHLSTAAQIFLHLELLDFWPGLYYIVEGLEEVVGTLATFFAGRSDLYLLKVDSSKVSRSRQGRDGNLYTRSSSCTTKLGDGLRYDEMEGVGIFPHFYGPDGTFTPLPLSAVKLSAKIELKNGKPVLPFDLDNNIS